MLCQYIRAAQYMRSQRSVRPATGIVPGGVLCGVPDAAPACFAIEGLRLLLGWLRYRHGCADRTRAQAWVHARARLVLTRGDRWSVAAKREKHCPTLLRLYYRSRASKCRNDGACRDQISQVCHNAVIAHTDQSRSASANASVTVGALRCLRRHASLGLMVHHTHAL